MYKALNFFLSIRSNKNVIIHNTSKHLKTVKHFKCQSITKKDTKAILSSILGLENANDMNIL